MTYVELIVVLSIFGIMSSIVLFNYGKFQAKVDIKNLANDIALKIVQAQKDAMSGKLPIQTPTVDPWRPSYGVYFNLTNPKSFIYFADLNNDHIFNHGSCYGECLDDINITKGNSISKFGVFYQNGDSEILNDLVLTFTRPDSGAIMYSNGTILQNVSYIQIAIISPQSIGARIKLYSSGRIEILSGTN